MLKNCLEISLLIHICFFLQENTGNFILQKFNIISVVVTFIIMKCYLLSLYFYFLKKKKKKKLLFWLEYMYQILVYFLSSIKEKYKVSSMLTLDHLKYFDSNY
jgi:hypothetical protein